MRGGIHSSKDGWLSGTVLRTTTSSLRHSKAADSPDLFSQIFDSHVAKSTLPRICLHDLRHTHASILLKVGVPLKVVSERLGHSSPAFTMTAYQHVLPGMQADAAIVFSRAVLGNDVGVSRGFDGQG